MKRVIVFQKGDPDKRNGRVVGVSGDLDELLAAVGEKLGVCVAHLYTVHGALVDDVELIRDDEVVYAATEADSYELCSALDTSDVHHEIVMLAHNQVASSGDSKPSDWITLNVGGQKFTTTRSTLITNTSDHMLARMFAETDDKAMTWSSCVDADGAYLIDRSPRYFEPILNFLRHGQLILDKNLNPEGVLEEAKFYGISELIELLEEITEQDIPPNDHTPITRREFVFKILAVPNNTELRCQGLNFTGANLSKLDLRYINFKYAILRHTNLSGANLSHCNFERADLSKSVLDGANLLGAKMLCVNIENASLKGCNFEDPAGSRANMEGAHMKNVNLDSSHMAGVNLRVANLKNANLQNCDLRGAVLAGADLENCNLSGCDLQEANLRGANLKGAAFELMLNALHMSQAVNR